MTKQPNSDQGNRAQRRRAEREAPPPDIEATPAPQQQGGAITVDDMVGELGSRDMEIIRLTKLVKTKDAQIATLADKLAETGKPQADVGKKSEEETE